MMHYKNNGYVWYDFLGGEDQYKKSLSSTSYPFELLTVYRSELTFKLSKIIKKFIESKKQLIKYILNEYKQEN